MWLGFSSVCVHILSPVSRGTDNLLSCVHTPGMGPPLQWWVELLLWPEYARPGDTVAVIVCVCSPLPYFCPVAKQSEGGRSYFFALLTLPVHSHSCIDVELLHLQLSLSTQLAPWSDCTSYPIHILEPVTQLHWSAVSQLFAPFTCPVHAHHSNDAVGIPRAHLDPLCTSTTALIMPSSVLFMSPTQEQHHTGVFHMLLLSRHISAMEPLCWWCGIPPFGPIHITPPNDISELMARFILFAPFMDPVQLHLRPNGVRVLLFCPHRHWILEIELLIFAFLAFHIQCHLCVDRSGIPFFPLLTFLVQLAHCSKCVWSSFIFHDHILAQAHHCPHGWCLILFTLFTSSIHLWQCKNDGVGTLFFAQIVSPGQWRWWCQHTLSHLHTLLSDITAQMLLQWCGPPTGCHVHITHPVTVLHFWDEVVLFVLVTSHPQQHPFTDGVVFLPFLLFSSADYWNHIAIMWGAFSLTFAACVC